MLSYITIKTTNTLNFENISGTVHNELRQSYLRLFVQVEIILSIFRFSSSDTPTAKRLCACEKDG